MFFYEIRTKAESESIKKTGGEEHKFITNALCERSELNYIANNKEYFIFASNIKKGEIIFNAIFKSKAAVEATFMEYIKDLDIDIKIVKISESVLNNIRTLLRVAQSKELVQDKNSIMQDFNFDKIDMLFSENLIKDNGSKEKFIAEAESMLLDDTLVPEIERVYTRPLINGAVGHPVHYLIMIEDRTNFDRVKDVLLKSLYKNGRIQSKRYCYVSFDEYDSVDIQSYEALYSSCKDGTIIVNYSQDNETDSEYVRVNRELIETICDVSQKYKNEVLTILCLFGAQEKMKGLFYERLGNMKLVEIYENKVCGKRAENYLTGIAKELHIETDEQLFSKIGDSTSLLGSKQLKRIFDEWYSNKLINSVYPQYEKIGIAASDIERSKQRGRAIERLNEMIGVEEAKAVIKKALNYYKVQRIYKNKGIECSNPAMHMVFTGNPGTAKTTVARLFAEIMRDNGLLSEGEIYEIGRADIVGKYVGWTANLVKNKFKEAKGSVLFIDEAYSLLDSKEGSFGDEAINTIVQQMENNRNDTVVIFAGYPDKMEMFLDRNPGLRSRIAFHVHFNDYSAEELAKIADLMADKVKVRFTDRAHDKLLNIFSKARRTKDFGNGRYVRNIIEQSRMGQANRIALMNYDEVSDEILQTLTEEDVPDLTEEKTEIKIGF